MILTICAVQINCAIKNYATLRFAYQAVTFYVFKSVMGVTLLPTVS